MGNVKEPLDLADEMENMAKMHENNIWALAMLEGAKMIRELHGELVGEGLR